MKRIISLLLVVVMMLGMVMPASASYEALSGADIPIISDSDAGDTVLAPEELAAATPETEASATESENSEEAPAEEESLAEDAVAVTSAPAEVEPPIEDAESIEGSVDQDDEAAPSPTEMPDDVFVEAPVVETSITEESVNTTESVEEDEYKQEDVDEFINLYLTEEADEYPWPVEDDSDADALTEEDPVEEEEEEDLPYVYNEVTEENYEQILAGEEAWKELNEEEQAAVNAEIRAYYIEMHEEEFKELEESEIDAFELTYDDLFSASEDLEKDLKEAEAENIEIEQEQVPDEESEETVPESVVDSVADAEAAAAAFINEHLSSPDGIYPETADIYTLVKEDNYAQIVASESAYFALTDAAKAVVAEAFTKQCEASTLVLVNTYEQLLCMAYFCMAEEGEIDISVAEAKQEEILGYEREDEEIEGFEQVDVPEELEYDPGVYSLVESYKVDIDGEEVTMTLGFSDAGISVLGYEDDTTVDYWYGYGDSYGKITITSGYQISERSWGYYDIQGIYRSGVLGSLRVHYVDGNVAYCLEPMDGVSESAYTNTGEYAWTYYLNSYQRKAICVILAYGYPNYHNASPKADACATQLLIWEIVTKRLDRSWPYADWHEWDLCNAFYYGSSSFASYCYPRYLKILRHFQLHGLLPTYASDSMTEAREVPFDLTGRNGENYTLTVTNTSDTVSGSYLNKYTNDSDWDWLSKFSYKAYTDAALTQEAPEGTFSYTRETNSSSVTFSFAKSLVRDNDQLYIKVITPSLEVDNMGIRIWTANGYVPVQAMIEPYSITSTHAVAYMVVNGDPTLSLEVDKQANISVSSASSSTSGVTWSLAEDQPLENVTFSLYHIVDANNDGTPDKNANGEYALGTLIGTKTTGSYADGVDSWGKVVFDELDPEIKYYVLEETAAPYLYSNSPNLNTTTNNIQFLVSMDENSDPNTLVVKDNYVPIQVDVYKYDSDTNKRIDIDGAVFGLYAAQDIKNIYGTVVVKKDTLIKRIAEGEDGVTLVQSSSGNYYSFLDEDFYCESFYVKEITPPAGYKLNSSVLGTYTVDNNQTTTFTANHIRSYSVDCYNQPLVDLSITKVADKAVTGATKTETGVNWVYTENQKLGNVTFSLYKAVDANSDGTPDKTTNGDYALGELIGTKTTGNASSSSWGTVNYYNLEQGDYILVETNAPAFYNVVDSEYYNPTTGTVQAVLELYGNSAGNTQLAYTFTDYANEAYVYIDKYDAGTMELINSTDAVFEMYAGSDIKNEAGEVIVKAGELVATSTPVGGGRYQFFLENGAASIVPSGDYYVEEVKAPAGYVVGMGAQDFSLYTNKSATFTDAKTTTEVVIDFYDSRVTDVSLSVLKTASEAVTGATISANGVTWRYSSNVALGDVTFGLYNIVDDNNDGVADKDANGDYKLGSYISSQTTNASAASGNMGKVTFGGLKQKQYILVEEVSPAVYNQNPLANDKTGNVRVLIDLTDVSGGTTYEYTMTNGMGDIELSIFKYDSFNGEPVDVDTAVFELYAAEDVTDFAGNIIVPRDTLIDVIAKGQSGVEVVESSDGHTYFKATYTNFPNIAVYVKEKTAPTGYLLTDVQYGYDPSLTENTSWTTAGTTYTKSFEFYDEPTLVDLTVEKLADQMPTGATVEFPTGVAWTYTKNLPLEDVTLELYHAVDANDDGIADKDAYGDYLLGEQVGRETTGTQYEEDWGKVYFNDLRMGLYILCEVSASGIFSKSEYANDATGNVRVPIDLTKETDGEYTFKLKDYMVGLDLYIYKTNSSNGERINIAGGEFIIYANEDYFDPYGNKLIARNTPLIHVTGETEGVTVKTDDAGYTYYSVDMSGYPVMDLYAREVKAPNGFSVSNETIYSATYNETATSFTTTGEKTTYTVLTMKDDPLMELVIQKLADKAIVGATEKVTQNGVTWTTEANQPMGGVKFELYHAVDYDQDGTPDVKADGDYELGELVGEGVTGEYADGEENWGKITFTGLVQGYYVLIEKEAPTAYAEVASDHINEQTGTAQALIHVTSTNGTTTYEYKWIDYINKGYIVINKYDKRTGELVDTVGGLFGLYAVEDIYNEKGELVVAKDTLVATSVGTASVIAPNSSWYQGSTAKSSITNIRFLDTYTPTGNETESWDASENQDGSIMAYVVGNEVIIAGSGSGKIYANPDSSNMFLDFTSLTSITGLSLLNTSSAQNMSGMFRNTGLTTLDVSSFDTRNVTDFSYMFSLNTNLSSIVGLNYFNTSSATSMMCMFYNSPALVSLDVSSFNTSNVVSFEAMFMLTGLKTLDVSNFNTSNGTKMDRMFYGMTNLTELDCSGGFDTSNASMIGMFAGDNVLAKITVGDLFVWNTSLQTPSTSYITAPSGCFVDGNWYNSSNTAFAPNALPDNTADTYYAYGFSLTGLTISKAPNTISYSHGDTFDPTGMVVYANYSNGSSKQITNYTIVDSSLEAGDTYVTISYTENGVTKTTTQPVSVNRVLKSIAVTTAPTTTTYKHGDNFDKTGMAVTATYTDGSTAVVSGWVVTDGTSLVAGDTAVTVSYTEGGVTKTTTQSITINRELASIYVLTAPDKTEYFHGDEFSTDGMVIMAYYTDSNTPEEVIEGATIADITIPGYIVTNGDSLTYGQNSVTISYTDDNGITKTTTQAITVNRHAESLTITKAPTTTTYDHGDTISTNGMVVQVTWNDGTVEAVTDYTYNPKTADYNKQYIDVTYTDAYGYGVFARQDLTVKRVLKSIAITTPPDKTSYAPGDDFDSTGMVVTATYTDGGSEVVTGWVVLDGTDLTQDQTSVKITYSDPDHGIICKAEQPIEVAKILTSIAVTTDPDQTIYWHSDTFDATGMVVTAYYQDGTSKVLSDTEYIMSDNATAALAVEDYTNDYETETITLSYTDNGVTQETTLDLIVCNYKRTSSWSSYSSNYKDATIDVGLTRKYITNLAAGKASIGIWIGVKTPGETYNYDTGWYYNLWWTANSTSSYYNRGATNYSFKSSSSWQDFYGIYAYDDFSGSYTLSTTATDNRNKIADPKSSVKVYLSAEVYGPSGTSLSGYSTETPWYTFTIPSLYPSDITAADYYADLVGTAAASVATVDVGAGIGLSVMDITDFTLQLLGNNDKAIAETAGEESFVSAARNSDSVKMAPARRNSVSAAPGLTEQSDQLLADSTVSTSVEEDPGIYTINLGTGDGDIIPSGKYYVKEIIAPSGYLADAETQIVSFFEGTTSDLTYDAESESYVLSFYDTLIDSLKIRVTKTTDFDIVGATEVSTGLSWEYASGNPLGGVTFELYEAVDANGDGVADTNSNGNYKLGSLVGSGVTGGYGTDNWGSVYFGGLEQKLYVLVEASAPEFFGGATSGNVNTTTGRAQKVIDLTDTYGVVTIDVGWTDYIRPGSIKLTKLDAVTGEVIAINDAQFGLYAAENIYSITTGELIAETDTLVDISTAEGNGVYRFENNGYLPAGSYYILELKAPTGYNISMDKVYVNYLNGLTDSFSAGTPTVYEAQVTMTNLETPSVTVKKVSTETGNALSGAVFGLYAAEDVIDLDGNIIWAEGDLIERVTTGTNGQATFTTELPIGPNGATFAVREIDAPSGYQLSDTVQYVQTYFETMDDYRAVYGNSPAEFVLTFYDIPEGKAALIIEKRGEVIESVGTDDAGNYEFTYTLDKLAGAYYSVYANKDIIAANGSVLHAAGTLMASGLVTDDTGVVVVGSLPYGEYRVVETKAPYGYMVNLAEDYPREVPAGGGTAGATKYITLDASSSTGYFTVSYWNPRQVAVVSVNKVEADTDTPLAGAVFGLYAAEDITVSSADAGLGWAVTIPADTLLETAVSGADGTANFYADIPIDASYYVKEISAPEGYELSNEKYTFNYEYTGVAGNEVLSFSHTFENELQSNTLAIHKTGDGLTAAVYDRTDEEGKFEYGPTLLAGAVFDLYDSNGRKLQSNLTTNENGTILLTDLAAGYYKLVETKAPAGYVISEEETLFCYNPDGSTLAAPGSGTAADYPVVGNSLSVDNQRKTVVLDITKVAAETNRPLAGAEFSLFAAEDILVGSSPIREGDLIEVAVSDANGKVSFTSDLPIGYTFMICETKAPEFFELSEEQFVFTVEDSANSNTITVSHTFEDKTSTTNDPGRISILKVDTEGNPLGGAKFLLEYSLDEGATWSPVYTDADTVGDIPGATTTVVEEGIASTNEDGELDFLLLYAPLPEQDSILYRLTEVEAPSGYQLIDEPIWEGTLPVIDEETAEYDFEIEFTVENEWALGSLTVQKVNNLGAKLAGATYLLEYSLDDGTTWTPVFAADPNSKKILAGSTTAVDLAEGMLTTTDDVNPIVFSDLLCDGKTKYRLTEVQTPDGYTLLAEPIFEGYLPVVDEDSDEKTFDLSYVVTNGRTFTIPKTGSYGFVLPALASSICFVGIAGLWFAKKRRKDGENDG